MYHNVGLVFTSMNYWPHQCPNGCALKMGRREMPALIPGRAYRRSRLGISVVFSETRVIMD